MFAWENLVNVLVQVEGVAAAESGLLAFGDHADLGGIFVERGRICWAMARGMGRRLHEILQSSALERGATIDFDTIYQRCRANGTLLGQTLVDEGVITARELEIALRKHSAESLLALCHDELDEPIWRSRGERGYEPRFTFRPVDVFLDVIALWFPDLHAHARNELAQFAAPGRIGAAFRGDSHAMPIAAFGDIGVYELWNLGQWATQLPLATRELGASVSLVIATTSRGDTMVVWWHHELLFAVACPDRLALSDILAHLGDLP